ncbi:MAG: DUF4197 domain-containing protein [Candidatus Kapabacteria bacterium]|nr:DUF4197 domain-containing protein [Candidatus Kapabacteria bacterium]
MKYPRIIALVALSAFTCTSIAFAQTKKTTTTKKAPAKTTKSTSKTTTAAPAKSTPAAAPAATTPTTTATSTAAPATTPAPTTPAPAATPAQTTLTPSLASSGLQEALTSGIRKGVEIVSKPDGYLANPLIKIPFPPEFKMVEDGVRKIGLGSVADQAVTSMNRAAEQAASDALPIFLDAIKQLNFNDVMSILNGSNERAATDFLQRTTSAALAQKFKPTISDALDKVEATKYWGQITQTYNKIPFVQKVNPDLPDYVTQRALDGLFMMVAQEEKNIRQNPVARTTDVLQQVFGGITKSIGK